MKSLVSNRHGGLLRDRDWVRKSFMLSTVNMEDAAFRLQTLATQKFTDTRLGGNFTINNVPQYTRTADIRVSGLNAANQITANIQGEHQGMGRFYSEQIDDNSQQIFMQFGVAQFNGMASFFTGFYDNEAGQLANSGISTIAYYAGFALGLVVGIAAFPLLLVGSVASFFLSRPTSKYYYMKETMGLYWDRVNLITNTLGVNLGLVPRIGRQTDPTKVESEFSGDTEAGVEGWRAYAHAMQPDIFSPRGGVNVYAVANRAQRLDDQRYALELEAFGGDSFTVEKAYDRLKGFITGKGVGKGGSLSVTDPGMAKRTGVENPTDNSLQNFLAHYHSLALGSLEGKRQDAIETQLSAGVETLQVAAETPAGDTAKTYFKNPNIRDTYDRDPNGDESLQKLQPGYGKGAGFLDYWKANQREGGTYVGFRVDATVTVSESFSNSTKESAISSKINGVSSESRSARFSFSDGNTGFELIDGAIAAAKSLASGFLDSVHMSGLLSLAGSAYVDIPEQWQDSSTSMPSSSFTIELRAPYGHVLSRFMNLHVPLACLLAAALPISAGKQAYTSPFLCSLFNKGKNQIRLGIIDSLSITRCTGNMGITNNGECLGIDVTISIKDLSKILHVPIEDGFNPLMPWKDGLISDDSAFKDYMAILGNLSLADQVYPFRKMFLNLTRKRENMDTFFSQAHFARATSNNFLTRWPGTMYGIFARAGGVTL